MVLSEERYDEIKAEFNRLQGLCDEVETIQDFIDQYGGDEWITGSGDDFIEIDNDGDIYLIEDNGFGLEVSNKVKVINPYTCADDEVVIDMWS